MATYVDAAGAMREWINGQSGLVGAGNPIQLGAHLKDVPGAAPAVYVQIEELPSRASDGAEDPDMLAVLSFQVIGGTRAAATAGAVALAEALGGLNGMPALVTGAKLWAGDDVQGPFWTPDGDLPRLVVQATIRMTPL